MPHSIADTLPPEGQGMFVGRVWDPSRELPVPVLFTAGQVWDVSALAETTSGLLDRQNLHQELRHITASEPSWDVLELVLENENKPQAPQLLAPIDAQVIKACGVTFVGSMIERVIEERSEGEPQLAGQVRRQMDLELDMDFTRVLPGSEEAAKVKRTLQRLGWWSQYLEVGLGPDPEVFTKAPVLSAVGSGSCIGIPSFSSWNNPEPELVLVLDSQGRMVGATLGNDVNLRDVEGRSALLLGMAKDNNRSTALGPFIRIFDETFTIDDAQTMDIKLSVAGPDGFQLQGLNAVSALSRSFEDLVRATYGAHHQYPDGFVLFTGTLFTPTQDRDIPGQGFTHAVGDIVTIASDALGALINPVARTEELPKWSYGIRQLAQDIHQLQARKGTS